MFIKICANTNLDDAALAAELGADAVGFVFAPSKRRVTASQVAAITPHLPASVETIGVFYERDPQAIAQAMQVASLSGAQLHSDYDPEIVSSLREQVERPITIFQTVHWNVGAQAVEDFAARLEAVRSGGLVDAVLIDARVGAESGGTGHTFDWSAARDVLRPLGDLRVIVAGGLRPDNVAEAIRMLAPWGVDVASGVEAEPGRKDPEKLRAFLANARHALPQ
jgi:phosphoribosylanthranilate isomerase